MSNERLPKELRLDYLNDLLRLRPGDVDEIMKLIERAYLQGRKETRDHEALNNEDAARWNELGEIVDRRADFVERVALEREVTASAFAPGPNRCISRAADVLSVDMRWYDRTLGHNNTLRKFVDAKIAEKRQNKEKNNVA